MTAVRSRPLIADIHSTSGLDLERARRRAASGCPETVWWRPSRRPDRPLLRSLLGQWSPSTSARAASGIGGEVLVAQADVAAREAAQGLRGDVARAPSRGRSGRADHRHVFLAVDDLRPAALPLPGEGDGAAVADQMDDLDLETLDRREQQGVGGVLRGIDDRRRAGDARASPGRAAAGPGRRPARPPSPEHPAGDLAPAGAAPLKSDRRGHRGSVHSAGAAERLLDHPLQNGQEENGSPHPHSSSREQPPLPDATHLPGREKSAVCSNKAIEQRAAAAREADDVENLHGGLQAGFPAEIGGWATIASSIFTQTRHRKPPRPGDREAAGSGGRRERPTAATGALRFPADLRLGGGGDRRRRAVDSGCGLRPGCCWSVSSPGRWPAMPPCRRHRGSTGGSEPSSPSPSRSRSLSSWDSPWR